MDTNAESLRRMTGLVLSCLGLAEAQLGRVPAERRNLALLVAIERLRRLERVLRELRHPGLPARPATGEEHGRDH